MVGQGNVPKAIAHLEKYLSLAPGETENVGDRPPAARGAPEVRRLGVVTPSPGR